MQSNGKSINPVLGADHIMILNESAILNAGYTIQVVADLLLAGVLIDRNFYKVVKKDKYIETLKSE